jgi:hypothetical protein
MKTALLGSVLKWAVGPLVVMVLAAALGEARGGDRKSVLHARTSALPDAELRKLEALPAAALSHAIWALGGRDPVRSLTQGAPARVPGGPGSARVPLGHPPIPE